MIARIRRALAALRDIYLASGTTSVRDWEGGPKW